MIYLKNDYSEGCHPRLLEALSQTNLEATTGYGLDEYSMEASRLIKKSFSCPDADVHFLVGGTQANLTMIGHSLKSFEAVICAVTGHIHVHEGGAVEGTGHKILAYPSKTGKVTPEMIAQAMKDNPDEHTVVPGMVYISNATEIGTVYTKEELAALSGCCKAHGLYLYMDGARLGSALTSTESDLTPANLAAYCDAFYIGGTKNGALFGEAMVILNDTLKKHFRNSLKHQGAMLAKGRLLGIQFTELFRDDLWFRLAAHANALAGRLQTGLQEKGIALANLSPTNQIFPILPNEQIQRLSQKFAFELWGTVDETHSIVRLVTSWATPDEAVDVFLQEV